VGGGCQAKITQATVFSPTKPSIDQRCWFNLAVEATPQVLPRLCRSAVKIDQESAIMQNPKEATVASARQSVTEPQPVVSAVWLKEHLNDPQVAIADCRFSLADPELGHKQYQASHISGSLLPGFEPGSFQSC